MKPYDLLKAHRYEEAISAYRVRIAENAEDWSSLAGLASSLRAIGRYAEAIPMLQKVGEVEQQATPGHAGRKEEISCAYWCMGEVDQAMNLMAELIKGVLDRSIGYGDLAGGAKQGLLLHYMAVTTRDQKNRDFALAYLQKLSKKGRFKAWPGPAAQYVLGMIDFSSMLLAATKESIEEKAVAVAKSDLLARRFLCITLFHDGVMARVSGDEVKCMDRMNQCYMLENPLIESEWYLARHEMSRL